MFVPNDNFERIYKRDRIGHQRGGTALSIPGSPLEIPGGEQNK